MRVVTALSVIAITSMLSFSYGVNVGLSTMANQIGPALLQCVKLIGGQ